MGSGPSPLVPSLLIGLLIMATCGPSMFNSATFLSEVEETSVSFFFIIPLLSLLIVYFVSESIIVPLVLLLLVNFLSRMVMGPLILLVIIHVMSNFFPSYQTNSSSWGGERRSRCSNEGDGYGYGWGSFWLLLAFLVLMKMFS